MELLNFVDNSKHQQYNKPLGRNKLLTKCLHVRKLTFFCFQVTCVTLLNYHIIINDFMVFSFFEILDTIWYLVF